MYTHVICTHNMQVSSTVQTWLLTSLIKPLESEQLQDTPKALNRLEVTIFPSACSGMRNHDTFISALPLSELPISQLILV